MRTLPAAALAAFLMAAPAMAQVAPADGLFAALEAQNWVMHDAAIWPNGVVVMLYCHDETGMGVMVAVLPQEIAGAQMAVLGSPLAGVCTLPGDPS